METDVLIVGAGPTGLVLALWLAKLGVKLRIVDKAAEPGTTSRALAVQARTLELYSQLGLADAVLQRGHKVPGVNLWVKGERVTRLPFESIGSGLSPYSFVQIFPQDAHERLLIERLAELGVTVERQIELLDFIEEDGYAVAHLRGADGAEENFRARYIAGCDGARSPVRHATGIDFPGGTYRQIFYVADIEASGPAVNGELNVDLDEADFLAVFPIDDAGSVRLIGTVRDDRADNADTLTFEDISGNAIAHMKLDVKKVNWFSTYHVHHRVAEHFRKGRAFLLGDAAHIHSPAGGQGMNTGIGDAINLAWKLAAVLSGRAPDELLDTYEEERIGFARKLVATTDRVFSFVSAEGHLADILRTRVAPFIMLRATSFESVREFLFRTVSQITLNYRDTPLSEGIAGKVHGGDRLPWAPVAGKDNFASLKEMIWQIHIYGTASEDVIQWCKTRSVPLAVFDWHQKYEDAGLARDALYLMRPDSYVALADSAPTSDALDHYCAEQELVIGGAKSATVP